MANALSATPKPTNEPVRSFISGSPGRQSLQKELARQQQLSIDIPLVIGGKRVTSAVTTDLISPHSKATVLARTAQANADDCQAAIKAAISSRAEWAALPWEARAGVFLKAADLLTTKYRDKICAATMLGQSKTCFQSEIEAACELADFLRFNAYFAEKIYAEQPMHSPHGQWNRSEVRGLEGFVFAIGPFNFTAISVNIATAPALMGCSVVWKPAPTAMLASYYVLEILEEAGLPPGVINLLAGDPQVIGDAMLGSEHLSGIHFTGSSRTFDHLWGEVGKRISTYKQYPRIVGETGGKDFVMAHSSADPGQVVTALIRGAFEYQGQKCSAASRAYIPKSLWPLIKPQLIAETETISMGDPADFKNFISAVIDQTAFNKIKGYIDQAKLDKDATILAGGECDDRTGFFIRPTIIEASTATYRTMVEEIFGPVLTIYVYEDEAFDEILTLVDTSTPYGLTGAIFARDRRMIEAMSTKLQHSAGNFYINDKPSGAVVGQQPFGGSRRSGTNDKAGSMLNLLRWTSMRTIKENFLDVSDYRYPFMTD